MRVSSTVTTVLASAGIALAYPSQVFRNEKHDDARLVLLDERPITHDQRIHHHHPTSSENPSEPLSALISRLSESSSSFGAEQHDGYTIIVGPGYDDEQDDFASWLKSEGPDGLDELMRLRYAEEAYTPKPTAEDLYNLIMDGVDMSLSSIEMDRETIPEALSDEATEDFVKIYSPNHHHHRGHHGRHHKHNHHHQHHSLWSRTKTALLQLGPFESSLIIFVLGVGLGALLHMSLSTIWLLFDIGRGGAAYWRDIYRSRQTRESGSAPAKCGPVRLEGAEGEVSSSLSNVSEKI